MRQTQSIALVFIGGAATLTAACTTLPEPSGFLSTYERLDMEKAKGVRGKRLVTPKVKDLPANAPLVIDLVGFNP